MSKRYEGLLQLFDGSYASFKDTYMRVLYQRGQLRCSYSGCVLI